VEGVLLVHQELHTVTLASRGALRRLGAE
jgi:hypothetical protein